VSIEPLVGVSNLGWYNGGGTGGLPPIKTGLADEISPYRGLSILGPRKAGKS